MALGAGSACFWITCTGGSWVSLGAGVGAAVPAGAGEGVGVVVVAGGVGGVAQAAGGGGVAGGVGLCCAVAAVPKSKIAPVVADSLNLRPFISPPRAPLRVARALEPFLRPPASSGSARSTSLGCSTPVWRRPHQNTRAFGSPRSPHREFFPSGASGAELHLVPHGRSAQRGGRLRGERSRPRGGQS